MKICEDIAKTIYDSGKMPKKVNDDLLKGYASKLVDGITSGFGDLTSFDSNTPDYDMIYNLQNNVYQFSAAKSYTQMKALTEAIVGDDGKVLPWEQYKPLALQINDEQVNQWLQAEYNNAIAGSQMAGKWIGIEKNAETMPMLQYVTAGDDRVRPAHAAMDGTTLPVTDPFWNNYYPPNGWNCRCTVKQGDWQATPAKEVYHPTTTEVPQLFRFNAGKEAQVFPDDHPYFDGTPKSILKQGSNAFKQSLK
jgi:SPP1 gp7 family putative phage head morphogenesis protein